MKVNRLANRSFNDLSAYPLCPRLVTLFTNSEFSADRDLSKPVGVLSDPDPEHSMLVKRYQLQRQHHSENMSHPLFVSGFLARVAPFSQFYWDLNEGWDAGDRNFSSIIDNCSIPKNTGYEFVPEIFCGPEFLLNLNNFVLPSGKKFDIVLPNGIENVFDFVRRHRRSLESTQVREKLNSWIDLVFGVASRGKLAQAALNVFHPMSYAGEKGSQEWILSCGQVPFEVFREKHPSFVSHESSEAFEMLEIFEETEPRLQDFGEETKLARHFSVSQSGKTLVVTTEASEVVIYRLENQEFVQCSKRIFDFPRFSKVFEEHSLCYTVCLDKVEAWIYANGCSVCTLDIWNASALVFNSLGLYVSVGKVLKEFSICGRFVREMEHGSEISCLGIGSVEWGANECELVVGTVAGDILVYGRDEKSLLVLKKQEKIEGRVSSVELSGSRTIRVCCLGTGVNSRRSF
jgi:hypothetical protein